MICDVGLIIAEIALAHIMAGTATMVVGTHWMMNASLVIDNAYG